MVLAGIIALIFLGILLLFLEFFVVPGVSIFGIAGVIVLVVAIYFSYSAFGVNAGNGVLFGTIGAMGVSFYLAYRKGIWKKVTLNSAVTSKVNQLAINLNPGERGRTISRLAPMGTVEFDGNIYEAASKGVFINEDTEVEIISIENNKIIVKQIK